MSRFVTAVRLSLLFSLAAVGSLVLTGCGAPVGGGSASGTAAATKARVSANGRVMGGQQPVTAATIQLYVVGTTNGGAATPLLTDTVTTSDGSGHMNSNANDNNGNNTMDPGMFSITGLYTCPSPSSMVYITASGGDPGAGQVNPQIQLMSAIGACGNLTSSTSLQINEITTVAAVAALHQYMSGYNAIGSTSDLSSAFNTASEYANWSTGYAPGPNLPQGYTASTGDLTALANVIATCVNSGGGTAGDSSSCGNLLTDAKPPSGSAPADTVGALIDIENNPSNNVTAIFNLQTPQSPFGGASTSAPSDWSLPISNNSGIVTTVSISANPSSVTQGNSSTLTVTVTNANSVMVTGTDGSSHPVSAAGGTLTVTPTATTTYTATATGANGSVTDTTTVTVTGPAPTVSLSASPTAIVTGGISTLTASATNATSVVITGSDNSSYTLSATGGTQQVTPSSTTTYTATATGSGGTATQTTTVTVSAATGLSSVQHVVFMLQENHSFDNYFGMLNPYKISNGMDKGDDGKQYLVDGIDDKLSTTNPDDEGANIPLFKLATGCIQDLTSSWLESYGDESRYDFTADRINSDPSSPAGKMPVNGFAHTAENFAKSCHPDGSGGSNCSGLFSDMTGKPAMGYYDQDYLNYYYYMAGEFAVSDRWFSPLASKSIPNRIATFTGGTTQGLVFDPGVDDHLPQLSIPTIFGELSDANVTWKIYYTETQGGCQSADDCANKGASAQYPATNFSYLTESYKYLYSNPTQAACVAPTVASGTAVGDPTNSFCIDPTHIAPLSQYYHDVTYGTLPAFAFIEAGYGINDEHPGSGQSMLAGQMQVAKVVNALMTSSASWPNTVFFMSYDEGGGPYDHVPPVPGHTNDWTDATVGDSSLSNYPDISGIAVQPDQYYPCLPGDATHCDLLSSDPGAHPNDVAATNGFGAQIGFRLPNIVISPFTRKHYVSHIPMDHTAILKFVETRFINASTHLTNRDAAQPDLLDFFDFTGTPWITPPTPPTPVSYNDKPCDYTTLQ